MTLAETSGGMGCPGCAALPFAQSKAMAAPQVIDLALPGIHCAACIGGVENGLRALPEVAEARVNLSQHRVRIQASADASVEALIDHLGRLGYAAQPLDADLLASPQDQVARALALRTAVAGFAMMNVMLLSVAVWSGAADVTRSLFHWLSAMIALPAVAFCAQPFLSSAWRALSAWRLNMDVPISLAIVLASAMSLNETIRGGADAWFDAALSLTFFLLAGRWLDQRSRTAAQSAATRLAALEVPRVIRLAGVTAGAAAGTSAGAERETVPLAQIALGDRIAVLPGARVPVDGRILDGRSALDRSLLTGESAPVPCAPGDPVIAGEMNGSGALTVEVTAIGEDTVLRRMASMIDAAESARNRYTALADRAARIYAPAVHLLALAGFVAWIAATGDLHRALGVAVAVLIITCPCALGLAVPAVSIAAAGHLFRRGVLVKSGTALERLAGVDTVVFDKTGTLTEGVLRLEAVDLPAEVAAVARALAGHSTHPVARAVATGLARSGAAGRAPGAADGARPAPLLSDIDECAGAGLSARWQGAEVRLGSAAWTGQAERPDPGVWLATAQGAWFLPLDTRLRPGAAAAVAALRAKGLGLHLISGDTEGSVAPVARQLGLTEAHAGLLPQDKRAYLDRLAAAGHRVLMVGDGLNDAAALAAAWASVAPASAADAARVASDVVLLGQGLDELPALLRTATRARRRALENFAISALYNVVAVPLALAGIATPLMAAIAMSASSITVLLNAQRIRS